MSAKQYLHIPFIGPTCMLFLVTPGVPISRGVPRIEIGGVRIAIGGVIHKLGSVVIRSMFGVRMHALYQGGVRALWAPYARYAPDKVILGSIIQGQITSIEHTTSSAEKLARGLLLLLFNQDELAKENCTKPVRADTQQLDHERLWAIRCKKNLCIAKTSLREKCFEVHL